MMVMNRKEEWASYELWLAMEGGGAFVYQAEAAATVRLGRGAQSEGRKKYESRRQSDNQRQRERGKQTEQTHEYTTSCRFCRRTGERAENQENGIVKKKKKLEGSAELPLLLRAASTP